MELHRRHDNDERVRLFLESDGLHIAWEDSNTGEVYGGVAPGEEGRSVLMAEGVDPDTFFAEEGNS